MEIITCPHCAGEMRFVTREQLQLGKTGWLLGDLPNRIAGALEVDIYLCPSCRKLEFFAAEEMVDGDALPQKRCPACGVEHDFDYPRCPKCDHEY
jgi:ssDNA-binding Zn-finger/Zn-ribbon topoisomerase 1